MQNANSFVPVACRPLPFFPTGSTWAFGIPRFGDAGILRPLADRLAWASRSARGERTPRAVRVAFVCLSYMHLFGTPLTSIVLVGFTRETNSSSINLREHLVELLLLVVEGDLAEARPLAFTVQ